MTRVTFDTCISTFANTCFLAHFSAEDFGMAHIPTVKFPTACAWVSSAIMGGEEVFIGLSERNKLYVNTVTVSSECNSFALHSNYVLFTTLSHVLRFMNLQRTVQGKSHIIVKISVVLMSRRKCGCIWHYPPVR